MDDCSTKIPPIPQPSVSSGAGSGHFTQQDLAITESVCTEWTNEKHSLYLKSMEASFVEQLYDSMDLLDLKFPKGASDQNISTSSSQFKVLRSGCWKRINFQRPETQVNVKNESSEILTNPWVQHYKSARTSQIGHQGSDASLCQVNKNTSEKKTIPCGRTTCSNHSRHDLVGCSTVEVSDQNFVDEDIQTEKKSSNCSSKRLRIRKKGNSSNGKVRRHSTSN